VTSERKIEANRRNARASTGPKTVEGSARAAKNARRHGLSVPIRSNPILAQDAEQLAREIAGADAGAEIQESSRRLAEAEIDLHRIEEVCHQRIRQAFNDASASSDSKAKLSRRSAKRTNETPSGLLDGHLTSLSSRPQGVEKLVAMVAQAFVAIDRYERRALSRRKFAIRALDLARCMRRRRP
jgi:hypothetical protein